MQPENKQTEEGAAEASVGVNTTTRTATRNFATSSMSFPKMKLVRVKKRASVFSARQFNPRSGSVLKDRTATGTSSGMMMKERDDTSKGGLDSADSGPNEVVHISTPDKNLYGEVVRGKPAPVKIPTKEERQQRNKLVYILIGIFVVISIMVIIVVLIILLSGSAPSPDPDDGEDSSTTSADGNNSSLF